MRPALTAAFLAFCGLLQGCVSWHGSPGADFRALGITEAATTDGEVADRLGRRPAAGFPAVIAAIRVQGSGYGRDAHWGPDNGGTKVITLRDVEKQEDFDRFARMPMISAVVPINGMAVPTRIDNERDLRAAAAVVHADLALLYTISSSWDTETTIPLVDLVTIGVFPNQQARVTSTAAAALVDVRTGYVYALAESTDQQQQIANRWTSDSAEDQTRRRTERKAFEGMLTQLESTWKGVADHYAATVPAAARIEYVAVPARPAPSVHPATEPGWDSVPRGVPYRTR
jgi:hypothetical protein